MRHIEYTAHIERCAELRRQGERQRSVTAAQPPKQASEPERPRYRSVLLKALRPSRAS